MITGSWRASCVAVEVFPGGALASITLTPQAIRLGANGLAAAILSAVSEATAVAKAEATTPQSWRVP